MSVLVDTSVWSKALRNKGEEDRIFMKLIQTNQVRIIGVIRQEILSGIKDAVQFKKLHDNLSAFPDAFVPSDYYVKAAQLYNTCRSKGIQASHIDFLIAAVAIEESLELYTYDMDFKNIATVVPLELYQL